MKRFGRFGEFISCSNYPKCKYIKQETTGVSCSRPGCKGEIVVKKSKRGKAFYGCSEYPNCNVVYWDKPVSKRVRSATRRSCSRRRRRNRAPSATARTKIAAIAPIRLDLRPSTRTPAITLTDRSLKPTMNPFEENTTMIVRRYAAIVLLLIFLSFRRRTLLAQTQRADSGTRSKRSNPSHQGRRHERSQVMKTLSYLSDVIGPRLTASPGMKRANEWTRDQLTKWGLQNAHLEPWGPFGRGWTLKKFSAQVSRAARDSVDRLSESVVAGNQRTADGGSCLRRRAQRSGSREVQRQAEREDRVDRAGCARSRSFRAQGTRLNEKDLLTLADAPEPRPAAGRRNFGNNAFRNASTVPTRSRCVSSMRKARRC